MLNARTGFNIALLAAVLFALAILYGCGGNNSPEEENPHEKAIPQPICIPSINVECK